MSVFLLLFACIDYGFEGAVTTFTPTNDTTTWTPPTTITPTTTSTTTPAECAVATPSAIPAVTNDACAVPLQEGGFTPVVERELVGYHGYGPPVVAQLDDDDGNGRIDEHDNPDVIFVDNGGSGIVAVDGVTGSVKWVDGPRDSLGGVAVGDIDADGEVEIIASASSRSVTVMSADGRDEWTASCDTGSTLYFLYPAVADLDGDGLSEVICGRTILDAFGGEVGTGNYGVGGSWNQSGSFQEGTVPAAFDIDGDGILEVMAGNAVYDATGGTVWNTTTKDGIPAIADMDLDGEPEFVIVSEDKLWGLETDGTPTSLSITFAGANYVGPAAIGDLDGDGEPEIAAAGGGTLRAIEWDGTEIWSVKVQDNSGAAGPSLFDFEGDGYPEVVYADEVSIRVFHGLDGAIKLESNDHSSATGFETPIVADVDNDGEVEIVLLHGSGRKGLTFYGDADHSWPAGRQVWNQHAYSITNVGELGEIPRSRQENWEAGYNSFRSGVAVPAGGAFEDVLLEVVEVCVDECPDRLVVAFRVHNVGVVEVPAGLPIAVKAGFGSAVLQSFAVPVPVPVEATYGMVVEIDMNLMANQVPYLEIDRYADGSELLQLECEEGNNGFTVPEICPLEPRVRFLAREAGARLVACLDGPGYPRRLAASLIEEALADACAVVAAGPQCAVHLLFLALGTNEWSERGLSSISRLFLFARAVALLQAVQGWKPMEGWLSQAPGFSPLLDSVRHLWKLHLGGDRQLWDEQEDARVQEVVERILCSLHQDLLQAWIRTGETPAPEFRAAFGELARQWYVLPRGASRTGSRRAEPGPESPVNPGPMVAGTRCTLGIAE